MTNRNEPLDWLRGLMALGIMIYHYMSWNTGHIKSGSLIGNLGVYSVSIFFVLSGLSMAIVYNKFMVSSRAAYVFFIRRLFRLLPLLWIAIAIVLWLKHQASQSIDFLTIILNVTLLYGFISPSDYINVGAWSIGNECVYYAMTPFLLKIFNKSKLYGNLIVLLTVLISLYFAFIVLNPQQNINEQWDTYINPFNNLFFYVIGISIYYNFQHVHLNALAFVLILTSFSFFAFYPISGNQINIVTGFNRILFSLVAILMVLGFYKLELKLPWFMNKPLVKLGEATYGIYLLHPIIYNQVLMVFPSIILTIIIANITYQLIEKPFIRLSKKLFVSE